MRDISEAGPRTAFPTEAGQAPAGVSPYRIQRTLRLRNQNRPGVLGEVATAIGSVGGKRLYWNPRTEEIEDRPPAVSAV